MLDLLTLEQSHAETIVRELINTFEQGADELNLNCEYDISAGQISDTKDNTWFVFDTQEGTLLDEFKTALFATELSEEEHKIVEVFIKDIMRLIEKDHIGTIRNKIREVLLPASDEETLPLDRIKIWNVEIVDYSSVPYHHKFLSRVKKVPGAHIDTKAVADKMSDLREKDGNAGKPAREVFEENRDEPEFEGILEIEDGEKYLNDVTLAIFVDYSFSEKMMESAPR